MAVTGTFSKSDLAAERASRTHDPPIHSCADSRARHARMEHDITPTRTAARRAPTIALVVATAAIAVLTIVFDWSGG